MVRLLDADVRPPGWHTAYRTHGGVAAAVAGKRADWGVCLEPSARAAGLAWRPLEDERYDFLVPAERWDAPGVRAFRQALAHDEVRGRTAGPGVRRVKRGALVLCGGESSRMGRDKASLPFGDETLLQRVVRLVSPAVEEVVVVARPDQDLPPLPRGTRVTRDEVPGLGPLAGLAGGLAASRADAVYATACDVPFLHREVVDLLFGALGDAHAAVVEADGFVHPLAAVYRKEVASVARDLLAEGRPRPFFLFERVPTVRVGSDALRRVDPDLDTLENLNTEDAYEAALARLAARRSTVRVELYEVARRIAGVETVDVEAETLGEALGRSARATRRSRGGSSSAGRLAPHWRASVDGRGLRRGPPRRRSPTGRTSCS